VRERMLAAPVPDRTVAAAAEDEQRRGASARPIAAGAAHHDLPVLLADPRGNRSVPVRCPPEWIPLAVYTSG